MPLSPLAARARALWADLAGTTAGFTSAISVAVSPRSRLCPPGWTGIVVIEDTAIATAPDPASAHHVRQALGSLPAASLTDTAVLSRRLQIADIRGPATLAYLDPAEFRPGHGHALMRPLDPNDLALRQFLSTAGPADLEESGMTDRSPFFTGIRRSPAWLRLRADGYTKVTLP